MVALAEARCALGALAEALPMFERAVALLQTQPTSLAGARVRLGACLASTDPARAASELDAALGWLREHAPAHQDRQRAQELRAALQESRPPRSEP